MKRGPSIRAHMLQVVMTTTLAALLISAAVLLLHELRTDRHHWVHDLQTQAELVAQASGPALLGHDAAAARRSLALLRQRLRPQVEAAAIYDIDGQLFAAHVAPGSGWPEPAQRLAPAPPGVVLDADRVALQQPISDGGRQLGTLVLQARYDALPPLLYQLALLGVVTLFSLVLAALVARRLQRAVVDPIVAVSDIAREVVHTRNFALRAPRSSSEEVGALVDAFNDMLAELGAQAAQLQATDRRKDEFLATLAHELRNPLAPVATALALLQRGGVDVPAQARLVDMMQRQMQKLVRLIDDLMEVSRVSTGRLQLQRERVELVPVLREALAGVAAELAQRRHSLAVSWPAPVWLFGDRTRLVQVFGNLLANAVRYTEAGGRIEIGFRLEPEAVEVCISDSGIGIEPGLQTQVFEIFFQVDRSLSGGRAGLGVGLALARQLVLLHDGSLTLHSAGLGQGSTFCVRLPRLVHEAAAHPGGGAGGQVPASAPAPATAPAAPPPPAAQPTSPAAPPAPPTAQPVPQAAATHGATAAAPPLQVLLADDNRDFADSLAVVLQSAGHQVTVAYDGPAALRAAHQQRPDVGLFDIGMPGLDGYELAAELRKLPGGQRCLLMAVTGWGQRSDQALAHEAGFDQHLVKPVDIGALLQRIAQHAASLV
jgi:signal transduction histidine kinase/ActR/RegA family two-component response regulator